MGKIDYEKIRSEVAKSYNKQLQDMRNRINASETMVEQQRVEIKSLQSKNEKLQAEVNELMRVNDMTSDELRLLLDRSRNIEAVSTLFKLSTKIDSAYKL